ncbi:MAG: aldehyde dehydrogenase [Alphaproteobacteria bacterium]|nr:MAG: aldehyde dehydrogenase [Alphaproteobacteria bacterium]
MLKRREAIATLMANRPKEMFVVPGLGSTTYDMASLGEKDTDFYLWGAMGGAAMIGLGLALAQPKLKVAVITGDGEMLMGMGALATIGVQRPANLAVIVFDNRHYGETGMQPSHTDKGVDLVGVARACGIARAYDVQDQAGLEKLAGELVALKETLFARVHIAADDPPRVLPTKDGVELKNRFRRAVAAAS